MKERVLITGGAGFIGSHTADALIKRGYMVTIMDSLAKPVHSHGKPTYLNNKANFIKADIRHRSALINILKNVDYVYHLAAYQDYLTNFSKYFDVNSKGTALLYETIVENRIPIKKIIVASSQAVYGEGKYKCLKNHIFYPKQRMINDLKNKRWDFICPYCGKTGMPQWINENDNVNPHNSYAISKLSQELISLELGKRYNIPTSVLRYSIVQGERQSPYNLYSGALRIFVNHVLYNKSAIIYEDGNQMRDYTNINDVVQANILMLKNQKTDYEIYNVGSGRTWSVKDFYHLVNKVLGKSISPRLNNYFRMGDTRHIFSSIEKIKKVGYMPLNSIEDSIFSYAKWIQKIASFKPIVHSAEQFMKKKNIIQKV